MSKRDFDYDFVSHSPQHKTTPFR